MPELPEVETIVRQLQQVMVGLAIQTIEIRQANSWSGEVTRVVGQKIVAVDRRAKMINFRLSSSEHLLCHLKMSGQLIYVDKDKRLGGGHPSADWVNALPSSHTRVIVTFNNGAQLFFNDQRRFGWLKVLTTAEIDQIFADIAPDIIDSQITPEYLYTKIHRRRVPIKQLIMDNQVVAGVGNIYACDALNLAKISPTRSAADLSLAEVTTLLKSMGQVIYLGIANHGATVDKYVHASGLAGNYQNVMRVYNKEGQPCPNCGQPIKKIKLAGRGTYFCAHCQK